MSQFQVEKPKRRVRIGDILAALFCLGLGVWLMTYGQEEWRDDRLYRVQTRLSGPEGMLLSDEVKPGREMNRNRMILGIVFIACSGYLTWRSLKPASNEKKG